MIPGTTLLSFDSVDKRRGRCSLKNQVLAKVYRRYQMVNTRSHKMSENGGGTPWRTRGRGIIPTASPSAGLVRGEGNLRGRSVPVELMEVQSAEESRPVGNREAAMDGARQDVGEVVIIAPSVSVPPGEIEVMDTSSSNLAPVRADAKNVSSNATA